MSNWDPNVLQEDLTLLTRPPPETAAGTGGEAVQDHYPVLAGVAVALVLALLALRWKAWHARRERRREAAHLRAVRELTQWLSLTDESQYRGAVAEISATLRRYVEERFGIAASTRSTEQFLAEQHRSNAIPQQYMPFWHEFLKRGDAIKYAGDRPSQMLFRHMLEAAVQFVSSAGGVRK